MSAVRIVLGTTTNSKTFQADAAAGVVKFYRVRANGTTRHLPLLPVGSEGRDQAEDFEAARILGYSVAKIAKEFSVSSPTVRRGLASLALSREVESLNRTGVINMMKAARDSQPVQVEAAETDADA